MNYTFCASRTIKWKEEERDGIRPDEEHKMILFYKAKGISENKKCENKLGLFPSASS